MQRIDIVQGLYSQGLCSVWGGGGGGGAYRQNIDKPQLASISGKIFTLQIPFLESGSQNCKNRVQ